LFQTGAVALIINAFLQGHFFGYGGYLQFQSSTVDAVLSITSLVHRTDYLWLCENITNLVMTT